MGYWLMLGGTRHFGYYESEHDFPWPIGPALRRMEGKLFSGLNLSKGKVLDAGFGSAYVVTFLVRGGVHLNVVFFFFFFFLERHVERAKADITKEGLDIAVIQGDFHNLDFYPGNSFDGLYTYETFVHSADPVKVLRDFHRILKPRGHLALLEYSHEDLCDPQHPHRRPLREELDVIAKYTHLPSFLEVGELHGWIGEAGFMDTKQEDLTRHAVPMMWLSWTLAIMTYLFMRCIGLDRHVPNASAGVFTQRGRYDLHFNLTTARARGWTTELVVRNDEACCRKEDSTSY